MRGLQIATAKSGLEASHDMSRILIVEDERAIRQLLAFTLNAAGHDTVEAADAMSAMDEANRALPDLALLDWALPDMEGLRLLRFWRSDESTAALPVIMVSARATEPDRVTALRAGADDYISKPFGRDELLARIQAVLRRTNVTRPTPIEARQFGGLALDVRSLRVTAHGKPLSLGPIEFRLLNLFLTQPDRALSRAQIVDRVWRSNVYVDERTVDVHVRRLRQALQVSGHDRLVQTVRGVGYRFGEPPATAARPAAESAACASQSVHPTSALHAGD
jgi:two-component system phosphate regulon response regulator PhoB